MIIANSALCASLAIYPLISNARLWNTGNFLLLSITRDYGLDRAYSLGVHYTDSKATGVQQDSFKVEPFLTDFCFAFFSSPSFLTQAQIFLFVIHTRSAIEAASHETSLKRINEKKHLRE